ncbi:hypothetical protein [Roseimaritima sediminicola]|uniref:hypothetical protein n=1 Tax=Roseimaritima sediminicola TaxID=2662066 RepID=UPI0012984489|nr:hypothetical protein [Roseimaritima sediminicola]
MPTKARSSNRRKWIIVVVSLVTLVACVGLATLVQGKVQGTEFSPADFAQRRFSYWEIPLVQLQISPIRRTNPVNNLTTYLRAQSLIRVPSARQRQSQTFRWDLVRLSRGSLPRPPGDAEILVAYLDGDSGTHWRTWSVDHPQQAQVLWPVIQRLARRELYVLVPDLFALAQSADSPEQLGEQMDQYLRYSYHQIAADLHAAGKSELAAELLDEALGDYPDAPRLRALRRSLPAGAGRPPADVEPPQTAPPS